uniref:Reverse transcriptase zinc-binding domain-containing protein n=2 Tax=Aegilops tauschii subsp. strangulata TaxID=200361 RepID=A0A453K795_AEGTS
IVVCEVLMLFGRASGLMVNYAESSASLLHCDTDEATAALAHLRCPTLDLPITYLGIPLTIGRPTAAQLQPLVDGIARRLPAWKANPMNKTGCLALVKSVLGAIPVHQLLTFVPPKKTLRQIKKIQRGFLWVGRAAANGGHCHINWRRVCRPISHRGLGVQDLGRSCLALRLRWLWFSRTDHECAWSGLDLQFSADERALFFASTMMNLRNGSTAYFLEDRWINGQSLREIALALYNCIPKRRRKIRTVAQGLQGHSC